jgi:hypothetical protein
MPSTLLSEELWTEPPTGGCEAVAKRVAFGRSFAASARARASAFVSAVASHCLNHVMARHASNPGRSPGLQPRLPKAKVDERAARMVANELSITLLVNSSFCQTKPFWTRCRGPWRAGSIGFIVAS